MPISSASPAPARTTSPIVIADMHDQGRGVRRQQFGQIRIQGVVGEEALRADSQQRDVDVGLAVWPPLEHAVRADAQPMAPIAVARRRFTWTSFHSCRRPVAAPWQQVETGRIATDPNFVVQTVGCLGVTRRRETAGG